MQLITLPVAAAVALSCEYVPLIKLQVEADAQILLHS